MSKVKLERLLNLTALLIETPRPLPAHEIQERMEGYPDDPATFRQAFERDKRDLREMGIPLVVAPVPGVVPTVDGYRIPKDRYYLADPGLDPGELAALHLAASLVQLEGGAADDALAKLGALGDGVQEPGGGALAIDALALPGRTDLGDVFGAVLDRRPLRFNYRGEARTVDPYRLDFQRGRWYLSGFDHVRGAERLFRLDRVEGEVEVLDGPEFTRPPGTPGTRGDRAGGERIDGPPRRDRGPVDPWQLGGGEPVMAQLAVDAEQAPWVVDHLGGVSVVEHRDDGSVVVELPVSNPESFRSFALTFLDHAEVLGPPELRGDLVTWLQKLAG
jgi:predicted DNA-binding transcriptional regulator YafY